MGNSTNLLFQKSILIGISETVSSHKFILKKFLLLLGCLSFMAAGLAQSGTVQFSAANYGTLETDGTVVLELQRVGGSIGEITATIQTMDGTANITDDYAGIPTPLTLTWSDGNTSPKTVTLPIFTDVLVEGEENFTMTITSTNPDWVGTPSTATITITDVPPGTIQFASSTYSASETDGTVTLEIQRVGGSIGELQIQIQTFDGTANITDDYAGIPTPLTLTWSDGNTSPKTVTLPIFTDVLVEGEENFTMTITSTNPDWVGTPSTATITITDVPPGTIQFASPSYFVNENAGNVTLEIERVGGSIGELVIQIQTVDGTATIVDDYAGIPTPLTLTWSDGNTSTKTVTLPIFNDAIPEGDENFTMVISSTNPDWVGTPSTATVNIIEFDPTGQGRATLMSANYTVGELDGTVTLGINRVGGSTGELQVAIQTFDGTATITNDYAGIPTPLTLTWADGNMTTKTVTLPILPDLLEEGDETFSLDLTGSSLGSITSSTVTITDVPTGKAQFVSPTYTVNEADGSITLEIERAGGSHGTISFDIQTFDGTATIVDDYAGIPSPLTLTWADGNTSLKTVTLPIIPDALDENNETFTMAITSTNPDWVGTPDIATVTIIDDDVPVDCETPVTADAGADQTVCGEAAVAIAAIASGAGTWSGGAGSLADASMASTTYTPDISEIGTTVTLTWTTTDPDGGGPCVEVYDMMDINFDEEPDVGADNDGPVCYDVETINLSETGGAAISWAWTSSGAADFSDATAQNPSATGFVDGEIFTVSITDANGCTSSATTTVTVNPLPICSIVVTDYVTSLDLTASGGISYLWSTGETTPTINVTMADVYSVTVTAANGCESSCSYEVTEDCGTSWAYNSDLSMCLGDVPGIKGKPQWGFTNEIGMGTTEFTLVEGAPGLCARKGSEGDIVGDVSVTYDGKYVSITFNTVNNHYLEEIHVYAGCEPLLKKRGKYQTAPGQFPLNYAIDNDTSETFTYPYPLDNCGDTVWVAIHTVTCELLQEGESPTVVPFSGTSKGGALTMAADPVSVEESETIVDVTTVNTYPNPFANELNLTINIAYDAIVRLQLFDMEGKLILTFEDTAVNVGSNTITLPIDDRVVEALYLISVNTGKEEIRKKVLSRK